MSNDKILEFKCTPERCVYNSEDFKIYGCSINSFEYPEVQINKYNNVTIKGNIQELNLGVEYLVKAKEMVDKYGVGYNVVNIKREKPTSTSSSRTFLYEIITEKQTDALLEVYPNIVDMIMKNKVDNIDLSNVKGIGEKTFNVIKTKVIENFKLTDLVEEFKGLFSISIIKKLYERYPSIEVVRKKLRTEPYECLCKLSGIGFKTADEILLKLYDQSIKATEKGEKPILFFGFDLRTSYQRGKSCVDYILTENETNGNTYMHVGELKKQYEILVPETMQHLPKILKGDNDVIFDRELLSVCKKQTYETEKYIAKRIKEGLNINTKWNCDYTKFQELDNFKLTEEQCLVSKYMTEHNIVLLVGNAGSGKSSSTAAFINMLKHYNRRYSIYAPTGKASKVISGYTGENATTIHRGLMYNPQKGWGYNIENKLIEDVIIVDEFSMCDIFLFKRLLDAIDFNRTKLLLIGDDAQIPSVGAGNVLYDLISCGMIPTVKLNKVFRYGTGGLSTVATDTRMQKQYLDKTKQLGMQAFGEDNSYIFMGIHKEKSIDYAVQLYKKLVDKGYDFEDIAVLSCYNVGDYGVIELNKRLQKAVNPNPSAKITFGDNEFRLNDIVMNYANDYKAIKFDEDIYNKYHCIDEKNSNNTFIANGETGKVVKILKDAMVIDYGSELIYCPKASMKNIRLAYACTIHKCQGSEYKNVILLTPSAHTFMLNSNLLYVGISRAKENCYHLSEVGTVNIALRKKENFERKTLLQDFLKEKQNG